MSDDNSEDDGDVNYDDDDGGDADGDGYSYNDGDNVVLYIDGSSTKPSKVVIH